MPENKTKEIKPSFIDEKWQKVDGIVSTKINTLINYQLLSRVESKISKLDRIITLSECKKLFVKYKKCFMSLHVRLRQ